MEMSIFPYFYCIISDCSIRVFYILECVEDYSHLIDESVSSENSTSLESDSTIAELFSAQVANPMITRFSSFTYCTKTERKTFVTSITLPAIEKPKKTGPPIPKYAWNVDKYKKKV